MASMPPVASDSASGADMSDMAPTDSAAEDTGSEPVVLATILKNPDGTFKLVEGDEDESIHDEGAGDQTGAAEGAEGSEQQGQDFDSPGPLLKAILDIIENAQGAGEGTSEDNFQAGFEGTEKGAPTKKAAKPVPPAQKY